MTEPVLLVLAAGMGSRYGSLKQMDGVGPNSEAIIDYSIYDAIRARFAKVVFVIRHGFEKEFKEVFNAGRFGGRIEVDYVFQELDKIPGGSRLPEGREKPWGTNHAVMMGAEVIRNEPFAVINADDFYGRDAYRVTADFLRSVAGRHNCYCMVGYELEKTLSAHGSVSRGVCSVDRDGNLVSMVEHSRIEREGGDIVFQDDKGGRQTLGPETPVSMNMFGFTPDYFDHCNDYFPQFLHENEGNLKAEFYIPIMMNRLVAAGQARMRVLHSSAQWFGVTYKEDRPEVVARIRALVDAGVYPEKLWD